MGYIPGGGLFHSALGDFLAAASNKYAGFAPAAPGAVRLENATAAWLARGDRLCRRAPRGTLTSGGSMANLTAIVAAREARDPDGGGAVYLTRFAHHCIDKALRIAGRARGAAPADRDRRAPPDARGRARRGAGARRRRRRPALAGRRLGGHGRHRRGRSAATRSPSSAPRTAPGSMSTAPMAACSCSARRGGRVLGGIERADTVALDPHKTLFLPYGTGAVRRARRPTSARRVQRQRRLYPAARRERGRPVARPISRPS